MSDLRALCLVGGIYHPFDEVEEFYGQELRGLGASAGPGLPQVPQWLDIISSSCPA